MTYLLSSILPFRFACNTFYPFSPSLSVCLSVCKTEICLWICAYAMLQMYKINLTLTLLMYKINLALTLLMYKINLTLTLLLFKNQSHTNAKSQEKFPAIYGCDFFPTYKAIIFGEVVSHRGFGN